ncbi:MAG: EF-hand domain-containing protein [Woeseia sp.]
MTTITAEMEAELVRLFNRFDVNKNGFIEEREFGQILDSLGYGEAPEIRSLEFAAIDDDDDGRIRFREFADWWLDNR